MKNYTDLVTSAAPTAAARVRLRPVDARGVAIRDGLLADRQRVNREVTLLRGAARRGDHRPGHRRLHPKVSQAIWTAIQAAITGTSSVSSALQTAQGTISGVQQVSGSG